VAKTSIAGATKVLGAATAAALQRTFVADLARIDKALQPKRKTQAFARATGCVPSGVTGADVEKALGSSTGPGGLTSTVSVEGDSINLGIGGTISGSSGKSLKFSYEEDACAAEQNTVPSCPTADGAVDATKKSKQKLTLQVVDAGKTTYSQTDTFIGNAKLHGQVAEDAKLDYLDVDDQETYRGSGSKFTGSVVTTIHVRVDMRTGSYDPSGATATYTDASGATSTSPTAQSFASFIDKQISTYRSAEKNWLEPNNCATIETTPVKDKVVLTQGQTGQLQAKVKAKDGGVATKGKWELSAPDNATFDPTEAKGPQAQFGYTVTKVGADIEVKATLEATSTAGVAKLEWSEPTGGFQFKSSFTFTAVVPGDPPTTLTFVHEIDGVSCAGDPFGTGAWQIHAVGTLTITPSEIAPKPAVADLKATFPKGQAISASFGAVGGGATLELIEGSDGSLSFHRVETPPPVPIGGGGYQPATIDQTVPVTTDVKCPQP
jgi:hypothetical protein